MSRKEKPTIEPTEIDEMLPEYDLSRAVPGYTAFRIGEDSGDEDSVEKFWLGLGFEVEHITEPALRFSKAPDFLLKRQGIAVAVCEVKSMGEFDYTVTVNHADGTATETQHNWRESSLERVLRLAGRAKDQLASWNGDQTLTNIFVFVNHGSNTLSIEVQSALREMAEIDAAFWFEVLGGILDAKPVVIASEEGRRRLECQMGLTLDARLKLISAA